MNSNRQPVNQLPTIQELREDIVRRAKAADVLLKAGVLVPQHHAWADSDDRLTWWLGCPVKSSNAGISLFIYRIPLPGVSSDELSGDKETICAEIRLFMPETKYRDGTATHRYREHAGERFSAHLWVKTGPHWAFKSTSHLVDKEPYVYADTLEALCTEIIRRVNTALGRAKQWIAQQRTAKIEETCV